MKSFNRFGIVFALVALCALAPVTALAQWEVIDNGQIKENKANTNTLDGKLDKVRADHQIGNSTGEKPSGEEGEKPKEKLVKVDDNYGVSDCASTTSGTSVSSEQQQTCELIQRTRNSQYNYMVAMYDITEKRLQRLRDIEKERTELEPEQIGKLEDNTNKLIALKTLMDIDRQQTEAAMFAYEKRLAFLTQVQSAGAWAAMNGKKAPSATTTGGGGLFEGFAGLGDFASKLVGGAVMAGSLEALKSSRPDDFKRLSIDE
ncbi:hypothetical protein FZ025_00490 [Xanthomonas hyacinthi]|uniref:Uncharacterized protein n=1 Tax=Xanthomonas hyacinthi TaxID=56455 RepID=A0A2S7EPA4_9XANT|nr:hypothetical protein [Xanthomonas hyacinthi]KLD74835.1 hypothetical protein Y886_30375 [Xanthomonas hyacinthi DSM 19077]PPU94075.1 hypothetical protein XhyaCFBP1156_20365 [Xanthomonas hyacinthi]QGY75224.1 hypothetical protein FZ025_00490 [Xanthomonas hyacinthi]